MLFEEELAKKMEAQQRQFDARLAEELIKQKERCEEELQLKLRSMQPALSPTPLEPAAMQDVQPSISSISHEPQEEVLNLLQKEEKHNHMLQ